MLSQELLVRKTIVVITLLALLTGILEAPALASTSQKTPFNYDPDKIEPGTMYVYQFYTSSDQKNPEGEKYYYIKSVNGSEVEIELLSVLSNNDIELTKYELNMKYMMIESMAHQSLRNKEALPNNFLWRLELHTDFKTRDLIGKAIHTTDHGMNSKSFRYHFDNIPTFFYFFGHMALQIAMRFYPLPKERIDVWNYEGNKLTGVKIHHEGKETIEVPAGKIRCQKFELSGKGILAWLFGKKAWVWMSTEDGRSYMVRYKNNNSTAKWPMKELRLLKVSKITRQEWNKKVENASQ